VQPQIHPAQAAIRTRDRLLGSPLINNIGYVVLVLKRHEIESELPDEIEVTLQAQVEYEAGNSLGIGKAQFILTEQTDADWEIEKNKQSFWNGRYFVRLENVESDFADIAIYKGDAKISTTRVNKGRISEDVFVPGFYCRAGLQIAYDGFEAAQKKATIQVDDDVFDVFEGSKFLNNRCKVENIIVNDLDRSGFVRIKCGSERISLELGSTVSALTGGEVIPKDAVLRIRPLQKIGPGGNIAEQVIGAGAQKVSDTVGRVEACEVRLEGGKHVPAKSGFYSIQRNRIGDIDWKLYYREKIAINVRGIDLEAQGFDGDENIWKRNLKNELILKCEQKEAIEEIEYQEVVEQRFDDAIEAYERVVDDFPAERKKEDVQTEIEVETYGELSLKEAIDTAYSSRKFATASILINKFISIYPDSALVPDYERRLSDLYSVDRESAVQTVFADNRYRIISLLRLSVPEKDQANAEFIIGGKRITLAGEEVYPFVTPVGTGAIRINELRDADRVRVQVACDRTGSGVFDVQRDEYRTDLEFSNSINIFLYLISFF